jgi:hypothetical protein
MLFAVNVAMSTGALSSAKTAVVMHNSDIKTANNVRFPALISAIAPSVRLTPGTMHGRLVRESYSTMRAKQGVRDV